MTKETQERLFACYKKSNGSKKEFVSLLQELGYKEGWNGYEIMGTYIRVYVGAPDKYAGFELKSE